MPRRASTHVDSPAAVGARLVAARKAAGLSQRQLAFPGCTAAYISRIEAGARTPSYQVLREFAKRLGVSADYLATGDAGDTPEPDSLLEAEVALRLGDLDGAERLYRQVRESPQPPAVIARAEVGLGQVEAARGETSEAVELLEQALACDQLPESDASVAANALGRAYATQGRFEEAYGVFSRFLEVARQRGDQFEVIRFSVLLANAYLDAGNFGRAQAVLGDVLQQARESLDPMLRASLYWSQSRLYSSQGNTDSAAEFAQLTIAILKTTEHTLAAAKALLLLAHIENDRGNAAAALDLVDEGTPIVSASGDRVDEGLFLVERARALDKLGEPDEAASLMLGLVPRFQEARPTTAARAYAAAAGFFRSRGDDVKALELYELAAETFTTPDRHQAEVLQAMAEIHEERGNAEEALQLLKAALRARSGVPAEG
jgi:tetratricopeptide (TPR) repeat protein